MNNDPWKGLTEKHATRGRAWETRLLLGHRGEQGPCPFDGPKPETELASDIPALKNIDVRFRTVVVKRW